MSEPRQPPPFIVGETYVDRVGEYKVISQQGNRLNFEYTDGNRAEGSVEQKALIHRNILLEKSSPRAVTPPRKSSTSNASCEHFFTHSDVFPIIAEIIEKLFAECKQYVSHDRIVAALLENPEAEPFLDSCPKDESRPASWWAHNMVAWFSKVFTDGRSDWNARFERKKIDNKWAYRVVLQFPKGR